MKTSPTYMNKTGLGVGIALVFLLIGYRAAKSPSIVNPTPTPTSSVQNIINAHASPAITYDLNTMCHINGVLPDVSCTPGATNPNVTQANIQQTICVSGYTSTIRPPASYTNNLKAQQITQYGYADTTLHDYEEDHLISLELGGAPSDPKNLWPEPGASPNPKDKIENLCHKKVCDGEIQLSDAQHEIATNWQTACQ